ncbi:hypothetical protein ACFL3G_11895 [Planctomycetota bacterium]
MVMSKSLRTAIMLVLLVLFFAGSVIGEESLSGRDLLKAMRQKKGKTDKSAYTERKAQEQEAAEPNVAEAESEAEEVETSAPIIEKPAVAEKPAAKVVGKKATATRIDKLLKMVPADSHYCVRVNNFDFTLSKLDQYLAGVSPVPMGTQMLVRMQLAKILGSPQLTGLNMSGSFIGFGKTPAGQTTAPTFNILVPITNYNEFVSGNPNISEPKDNGASTITSDGVPAMHCKKIGGYALVSTGSEEALVELAESISSGQTECINKTLTADQAKEAMHKPIWLYNKITFDKESSGTGQLDQLKAMLTMQGSGAGAGEMNIDIEQILESLGSFTISANPKPSVLNFSFNLTAAEGKQLPAEFSKDSELMAGFIKQIEAVEPAKMSGQMSSLVSMVPASRKADYVGTCNLLELMKKGSEMSPVPLPVSLSDINTSSRSGLAYALKFDDDNLSVDAALPKDHLSEIAGVMMAMQQQMMGQTQTSAEPAMVESVEVENADSNDTVTLEIVGVTSDEQAEALAKRLQRMSDSRRDVQLSYGRDGDKMTAELAPVRNVKRFTRKIRFGEVTNIDGRKITIKADKDSKDKRDRKRKPVAPPPPGMRKPPNRLR